MGAESGGARPSMALMKSVMLKNRTRVLRRAGRFLVAVSLGLSLAYPASTASGRAPVSGSGRALAPVLEQAPAPRAKGVPTPHFSLESDEGWAAADWWAWHEAVVAAGAADFRSEARQRKAERAAEPHSALAEESAGRSPVGGGQYKRRRGRAPADAGSTPQVSPESDEGRAVADWWAWHEAVVAAGAADFRSEARQRKAERAAEPHSALAEESAGRSPVGGGQYKRRRGRAPADAGPTPHFSLESDEGRAAADWWAWHEAVAAAGAADFRSEARQRKAERAAEPHSALAEESAGRSPVGGGQYKRRRGRAPADAGSTPQVSPESGRSELAQKVVVHTASANLRDLINFLAPQGWRVRFDVAVSKVDRALVFHAETTRRRALDQLCASLGLKGIFYPRKRLVLIVEGRSQ